MAETNRSGDQRRATDDVDPDRTQRLPDIQAVVDRHFPDEQQGGGC